MWPDFGNAAQERPNSGESGYGNPQPCCPQVPCPLCPLCPLCPFCPLRRDRFGPTAVRSSDTVGALGWRRPTQLVPLLCALRSDTPTHVRWSCVAGRASVRNASESRQTATILDPSTRPPINGTRQTGLAIAVWDSPGASVSIESPSTSLSRMCECGARHRDSVTD